MTRDPSLLHINGGTPETPPIAKELAEHILTNPDFIFSEYQKLTRILKSKPTFSPREVSIIYRRELGDTKNPEFMFNQMAISWLILNSPHPINSPIEMVNLVETLSGLKSEDIALTSSGQVEKMTKGTSSQIKAKLLDQDDYDISEWLSEHAGRD